VFLHGLRLVEALQRTVVALIQAPAALDRNPHEIHFIEHAPQGADRAFEDRGKSDVGRKPRLLDLDARRSRLDTSLVGKIDVMPAGEEILDVPGALAVSNQNQLSRHGFTGHARTSRLGRQS